MPEHDNDRLEQFFRSSAAQGDVPFDERDWRKLESQLDAEDLFRRQARKSQIKVAAVTGTLLMLLFSGALWMNYLYDFIPVRKTAIHSPDAGRSPMESDRPASAAAGGNGNGERPQDTRIDHGTAATAMRDPGRESVSKPDARTTSGANRSDGPVIEALRSVTNGVNADPSEGARQVLSGDSELEAPHPVASMYPFTVKQLDDLRIYNDLIRLQSDVDERNKQKAMVELPGAGEAETNAELVVGTEPVLNPEGHQRPPRLSLLLSFAPDFSSTSLSRYSAPGKAFGAVIHYHITARWSVSAGAIKNNKQYSGNGEDYHPPHGYWKYYTNGRIPNSIDGACTVLEFPLMVNYSITAGPKNSLHAGAGVSSYLMLDESYRYVFDEPNPGAKEGWASRGSSRFLFNMLNVTVGYEHQLLPGFRIGIEPYVKIPVSEIGWSKLKLFSTGASVTLRYVLLRKKDRDLPTASRGPD